jgi:SPP1 family phage portal protein
MTTKEIDKAIENHRSLTTRYYDKKTYKIGLNAGIFQADAKPEPDNRIPVSFIYRALRLMKGYFAKAGNITYSGDLMTTLQQTFDDNDEQLVTGANFEDAAAYGSGYELHWYPGNGQFNFETIPVDQAIPIYTEDLRPTMKEFLWHRKTRIGDELVTWYDAKEYIEYRRDQEKKEWVVVPERSGNHLYGKVPVVEYNVSREKRNVFDHVLPLMDMYDRLISEVGNEHEKFANSILLLREYLDDVKQDENGRTDVDKFKDTRMLDRLGDNVRDAAAYLERNVNDTFIGNTLDRWERLIYEMLCIFNPNDNLFATASGIAQAYKLLGFELLIADMEAYFSKGLQNRIYMISGHESFNGTGDPKEVTIQFTRNLPFDLEKMAQIISLLAGGRAVISDETLLRLFPATLIPNYDEELARVKVQKASNRVVMDVGFGNE